MPGKNHPALESDREKLHERRLVAWPRTLILALAAVGFALAIFSPWPAGMVLAPAAAALALLCWIERRRASYLAAENARLRSVLSPYLPALPALADELTETAGQLESAVLAACDGFHGIGARAREALGGESRALEKEIVRVVVALQFQDIVNQRMTHAIETLTQLSGDLGACLGSMPAPEARPERAHPAAVVTDSACQTNESGHLFFAESGAGKSSQTEMKGDIEIFLPEVRP